LNEGKGRRGDHAENGLRKGNFDRDWKERKGVSGRAIYPRAFEMGEKTKIWRSDAPEGDRTGISSLEGRDMIGCRFVLRKKDLLKD